MHPAHELLSDIKDFKEVRKIKVVKKIKVIKDIIKKQTREKTNKQFNSKKSWRDDF